MYHPAAAKVKLYIYTAAEMEAMREGITKNTLAKRRRKDKAEKRRQLGKRVKKVKLYPLA